MDLKLAGGRLLALHDATFMSAGEAVQRNMLQVWDPVAEVSASSLPSWENLYEAKRTRLKPLGLLRSLHAANMCGWEGRIWSRQGMLCA